jgi:hypothetical protein
LLCVDPFGIRPEGRVAEYGAERLKLCDVGDHISGDLLAEARDKCVVRDAEDLSLSLSLSLCLESPA